MLCVKVGSHQFCVLYTDSLREEIPCCKMSAVCIPGESAGVEENFQTLHASVRETRKLPSPKLTTGKLGNKEITSLCVWCVCCFFFTLVLMHWEKSKSPTFPCITWRSKTRQSLLQLRQRLLALCPSKGKSWVAYNIQKVNDRLAAKS